MARLLTILLVLATTLPASAVQEVIDPCDYPDAAAAQAVWKASERSAPVDPVSVDERRALRLPADFTGDLGRAVVDRDLRVDLTKWDRFSLDLRVADPGLVGSFTIYFHSGNGWYGHGCSVGTKRWTTLSFTRAAFRTEGEPAGWDQVDRVRIAAWRGARRSGEVLIDNFVLHREEVVIVLEARTVRAGNEESSSVQGLAEQMESLLAAAGISCGAVTDEEVEAGALRDRKLAILPHNPRMTAETAAAVRTYCQAGGKLLAFYGYHAVVSELLGIRRKEPGWSQRQYPTQLAELRFGNEPIEGLPRSVPQDSWCLSVVEPVPGVSQVLAWWHDGDGKSTGWPAMLRSANGIYMSHVLLNAGGPKVRLVQALVGHYVPSFWPTVAAAALRGPERLGAFDDVASARAWMQQQLATAPRAAEARAALAAADTARAKGRDELAAQRYSQCVEAAQEADAQLRRAFVLVQPSRPAEMRAIWNHSGTGALPGGWPASMQNLHASGFNAVLPNMLWGGLAHYPSEFLPASAVVGQSGDQIAQCVAAARPYGIEVHVWKVNWNLGNAPQAFRDQLAAAGRLQQQADGTTIPWLCPGNPVNQDLEANAMVEVARKYEVHGVHFDYIRYPGQESCFCPTCRRAFEAGVGQTIANWPADLSKPEWRDRWTQFRCDNISRLVQRVATEVRRVKPQVKISAAVFSDYPGCRVAVGQDWIHWIRQGWLDFVCPMNYTESDASFASILQRQMPHLQGMVPYYPGIGVTASRSTLAPDGAAAQIQIARQLGADGFTVFDYGREVALHVLPELGLSTLTDPTGPRPHNAPRYTFDLGELTDRQSYARWLAANATQAVQVGRGADPAGRPVSGVSGQVVLEDLLGQQIAVLGTAPATGTATFQVTRPSGRYRVAVRGEATVGGVKQPFVTRSGVLVFGE
ncbi:MAG: family 10 glycosylhydrolase [Fimbriimonadaceae bacterium]|nr:family 10 glycosylhydrolase [Fimbriimonadaceae bacterium]